MKKFLVLSVILGAAGVASARDFRHLTFASTPTESDQGVRTTDIRSNPPYSLTGRRADQARPARTNLPTYVIDSPHFRPGGK